MDVARRSFLLLAASATTLASACQRPSSPDLLGVLREDALADERLLGLELASSSATGYSTTLGKPNHATLKHRFALADADHQQVLADAVDEAKAAGWHGEAPINEALLAWNGSKQGPSRTCALTIDTGGDLLLVTLTNLETP